MMNLKTRKRAALVAVTVATGSERREASIDLLIASTCNARDFAAKITHMTIAPISGGKTVDGQLMSSPSLLP